MFLETKRLLLREMNPEDYDALFRVLGDPETMWQPLSEGWLRAVGSLPEGYL